MKKLLFTLFAILCLQATMQGHDQFISIKNKYTFNLPQLGVGLTIPAYGGFTVPKFSGDNVFLSVNDQTDYFMDSSYSEEGNFHEFKFKAKGATHVMTLNVTYLSDDHSEDYLSNFKNDSRVVGEITSLKTKIGKTYSLHYLDEDEDVYVHMVAHNKYHYFFAIDKSTPKKDMAIYENIIKSIEAKDFPREMSDYENKVNSGYFDRESKAPKDVSSRYKFGKQIGTFLKPTTLAFQEIDMEMMVPANTIYNLEARNIEDEQDGRRQVSIYKVDLDEKLNYMAFFHVGGMSVSMRATQYESLISSFSQKGANTFKKKRFNLDGVQAIAEFGSSDYYGDLTIVAQLGDVYYLFTMYGITADNMSVVDDIVASIKLPRKDPRIMQITDSDAISSLFSLKKQVALEYNKITIPKLDRVVYPQTFSCAITDARIRFEVPGTMDSYLIRPDDNFKKVSASACTFSGMPFYGQGWFGVTSGPFVAAIDVVTYPNAKAWLDTLYYAYNAGSYYKTTEFGFVTINGIEWGVITVTVKGGSLRRTIYAVEPDFSFQFILEGSNMQEINEKSSFVHTFKKY